jgi:hypothetical protein
MKYANAIFDIAMGCACWAMGALFCMFKSTLGILYGWRASKEILGR